MKDTPRCWAFHEYVCIGGCTETCQRLANGQQDPPGKERSHIQQLGRQLDQRQRKAINTDSLPTSENHSNG